MSTETDPVLNFYRILKAFLDWSHPMGTAIGTMLRCHREADGKISLPGVDAANLRDWYHEINAENGDLSRAVLVAEYAFQDLHRRMKCKRAQDVFLGLKIIAKISGDLFIHRRRRLKLGGGFAVYTNVADCDLLYIRYMTDPQGFLESGAKLHFSESPEVTPPDTDSDVAQGSEEEDEEDEVGNDLDSLLDGDMPSYPANTAPKEDPPGRYISGYEEGGGTGDGANT